MKAKTNESGSPVKKVERWTPRPLGKYKLCRFCDQPMKPKGVKKLPNEYDHATGCPYDRKRRRS